MIFAARHEANSKWIGANVGIVTDPKFFSLSDAEREKELAPYAWVEFKSPMHDIDAQRMAANGFKLIDCQLGFDLDLRRCPMPELPPGVELSFADDVPFSVEFGIHREFKNERYLFVPGVTQEKLDRRYVTWANQLIAEHPKFCVRLTLNDKTQGWYFSAPRERGHELTLAMLHRDAVIRGSLLYNGAFALFCKRGATNSYSHLSAYNLPALNIMSKAGSRWTSAAGCWLWVNPRSVNA